MHLKGRSLTKWLLLLIVGVAFYFSFDLLDELIDKQMLGDHPEVILAAKHSAKTLLKILSQTGEVFSEEYKMNTLGSKRDSLELQIMMEGEKATATINVHAVKQLTGVWRIYQSDTTFTK